MMQCIELVGCSNSSDMLPTIISGSENDEEVELFPPSKFCVAFNKLAMIHLSIDVSGLSWMLCCLLWIYVSRLLLPIWFPVP